jgi:serine/threonine-protein kinase
MDLHSRPHGADSAASAQRAGHLPQIPGGRYHIVERLSAGAIGAVYKALDTILDRPVAVKCVNLDTPFAEQTTDELRERFVREARIAARLQHPNIVTIHDIVATADRGFIIMEFIEGQSLEMLLAGRKQLPLPDALRLISQLASAIDYAHGRKVVHRDVKPANILVSSSLWVWVTDFGIAKSDLSTNLTMAGGVLGTPDYMSPEQARGEDVDARSDLFSLGCILFESLTGEKPFRSASLTGVLLSIINDEPLFPSNWTSLGLPDGLKPVLNHALEKDRGKRFRTGADLVSALEGIRSEPGAVSKPAATRASEGVSPAGEVARTPSAGPTPAAQPEVLTPTEEMTMPEMAAGPAPAPARSIDPARVEELKKEPRPLRLAPNLSGELQGAEISPEEGFLLSRIDGYSRASDILAMSPMSEAETAASLMNLLNKDLIQFGGRIPGSDGTSEARGAATAPSAAAKGTPDEATLKEIDRLLALAKSQAYEELLGLSAEAPAGSRKSAYLKLIGKYHPDKFPRAEDVIREKLSRLCAEAGEALDQLAKPRPSKPNGSTPARDAGVQSASRPGHAPQADASVFDKRRYARDLYDRALRAFDLQDFWESIQLCRQALEVDETQADYFHLLGRALMQNKKWRKEAADNFRRASELDPANLAYLGMLGAVYRAEGLNARANAVLKKAQSIDPAFVLPEIDGEVSVQAE